MVNVAPLGPTGSGRDRKGGPGPRFDQRSASRRKSINRPLSTATLLVLAAITVSSGLLSTGTEGVTVPASANEDDYSSAIQDIETRCINRCPDQNQTSFTEHVDASCGSDCYIKQCTIGCRQWELALESSCQQACNVSDQELLEAREWSCIAGCNDGLSRYFRWLKAEIGTPHAPALVADSLTATALALEWEVPERLVRLARYRNRGPRSYLVQWRYEEVAGDWKYCRNQSMGDSSTVRVDNLQPYTKYRFRVALLLSPHHDQVLTSEQSVIISTLPSGVPTSEPTIVRAVAVDHSRISISWEPGPFPNGLVLSYVLQIKDLHYSTSTTSNISFKEIPESNSSRHYMFEKLEPEHNYSVSVAMRNPTGEGPAAVMTVATPAKPAGHEEALLPTLILGAERSILTQSSNLFSDPPTSVYASTDHKIRGTATHIRRGLLFVSDDSGRIYRAPSRAGAEASRVAILGPGTANNFRPTLLSVDWLNEHLYILGQARPAQLWQIAYCDFSGGHLTVAIAGLQRRPDHFAVDPYNGYLFWVVGGIRNDSGLFRLDLGDISNGVRHEIRPQQMVWGRNLGAFTLDHANFRVLVADQSLNTVLAVSLDGNWLEDIRNNTQQPRFERVRSLARANNLFYWTNGTEVFAEDYHRLHDSYYHNAFPIAANNTYFSISVNQTAEQPIPVPVNPPRNLQALASPDKLKVSWDVPYLLGVKGRGAWQSWSYRVEVGDEPLKNVLHAATVNGTSYACDLATCGLLPNRVYTVRAAAFTSAGRGPWSREFRVRTLRPADGQRHLVWASADGIVRSDVIGEHVDTLIPAATDLDGAAVTSLAWYDSTLYVVSNSTLRLYREPSVPGGEWAKIRELESVECVAVDWIGQRLYYSNPAQQLIVRSGLHGEHPEPIHSVMNVREIRFDAYRGFIYCSSGLILEAFRLNGKARVQYFSEKLFTGKQIIGMTLDHDGDRLFWIVRSYAHSHLYWAPLAGSDQAGTTGPSATLPFLPLTDQTPQGPLLHFSDRLLWLKEGQVVVGDVKGENLAYIRNHRLNGTRALTMIDAGRPVPPINVLPATVDPSTILVTGDWRRFNVSWEPVRNVNYSVVFYKLTLKLPDARDLVQELSVPYFVYGSGDSTNGTDDMTGEHGPIPPYTPIDVTVHAFTYWRSSAFSSVRRHTPAGKPSVPVAPRAYIQHQYIRGSHELRARIMYRWSPPAEPNGPIVAYRVDCWASYNETKGRVLLDGAEVRSGRTELLLTEQIQPNVTYYLQVRVCNVDHEGPPSEVRSVRLDDGRPLPLLYVATADQILLVDLDLRESKVVVGTAIPAVLLAEMHHERRLFWVNGNGELFMYDEADGKRKLMQVPSPVTALAVDWVARTVYLRSQPSGGLDGSTIHVYDLNRLESGGSESARQSIALPPDAGSADLLQVLPEHSLLVAGSRTSRSGITIDLNLSEPVPVFFNCSDVPSDDPRQELLCEEELDDLSERRNVVRDDGYLYWIDSDTTLRIRVRTDPPTTPTIHFPLSGAVALLPLQQRQFYPPDRCLTPVTDGVPYLPELINSTENTLTLLLPEPERHPNCTGRPPAVRYRIQYQRQPAGGEPEEGPAATVQYVFAYEPRVTISNLRPYTRYRVGVTVSNHYLESSGVAKKLYSDDQQQREMPTVFTTAVGAPSRPEDVTVLAISPTEAIVRWMPSRQKNSHHVWYEVYWRLEGQRNRQQQLVTDFKMEDMYMVVPIAHLQSNQSYRVCVRAYSNFHAYSESDEFEILTYPQPSDITLVAMNSTDLRVRWQPPMNCRKYRLQYAPVGYNSWTTLYESSSSGPTASENYIHNLSGLLPKTRYQFCVLLHYPFREEPYLWPQGRDIQFETMADRPAPPGRPVVTQLRLDVLKVTWDPAQDNGATVEEYALEGFIRQTNRVVRLVVPLGEDGEPTIAPNGTIMQLMEQETYDEHWTQVYNGTDMYWIVQERYTIHNNLFRVRARNSYGWGPYSEESRPKVPEVNVHHTVLYVIAMIGSFAFMVVVVTFTMILIVRQSQKLKNLLIRNNARLSDVELANLRELPRMRNFVHSTNILYSSGGMLDPDMALLPRIRSDQIYMGNNSLLGSGAFGEVYEGVVKGVDGEAKTRVAIKTLKKGAMIHEKQEFLQEAQLMSNFKHKHITRLLGVCLEGNTLLIIMELMQGGDLLSYLRRSRPLPGQAARLTMHDLISMCQDVASGCQYLEEMHFVHRDLACRNCLVSSADPHDRVVKIGDFGLARDIYKNDYYRKEGEGLLPVRWMSPESLVDGVFTSQSDIWAFGVLLWEIMTLGEQPYQAKNNLEVLNHVREGGHLDRPKVCPNEMYELMKCCWQFSPEQRPTFRYCLAMLRVMRENTSEDMQIIAPFPAKLQQEAVSNPSYQGFNEGQDWILSGTSHFRSDMCNDSGRFSTPPTSSSGSSGINGCPDPNAPKYLELVYEDSSGQEPDDTDGPGIADHDTNPPVTDNGYEIPITDGNGTVPRHLGTFIAESKLLPDASVGPDQDTDQAGSPSSDAVGSSSIMEREARS